jgi:hypothetical protein
VKNAQGLGKLRDSASQAFNACELRIMYLLFASISRKQLPFLNGDTL